jgi:hypothetical protein
MTNDITKAPVRPAWAAELMAPMNRKPPSSAPENLPRRSRTPPSDSPFTTVCGPIAISPQSRPARARWLPCCLTRAPIFPARTPSARRLVQHP